MRLYDMAQDISAALDRVDEAEGEITPELAFDLDTLDAKLEDKIDACCGRIRGWDLEAKAIREEEQRLAKRRKALENKQRSLREYVMHCLDIAQKDAVKGLRFSVRVGTTRPSVQVVDASALPERFVELVPKPDKAAIKAALDAGEDVPGAELNASKLSLTIR